SAPSIAKGLMQQFVATGTYSDGSSQNLTSTVNWSSSSQGVATISSGGLATGTGVGITTVAASFGTVSGSTTLTVAAAALVSIAVTPSAPSIAKGQMQQFVATGTYSDGSSQNLTSTVNWSSSSQGVATISNGGLATGTSVGTTTVAASFGMVSGSTTLTVTTAALVSIAVTPGNPSIASGANQQFTATGTYTDGSMQNITGTVTWTSNTSAVATISNAAGTNGLATSV